MGEKGAGAPTTCLHDACGLYNIVMPSCSHSRLIICHVIIIIIIWICTNVTVMQNVPHTKSLITHLLTVTGSLNHNTRCHIQPSQTLTRYIWCVLTRQQLRHCGWHCGKTVGRTATVQRILMCAKQTTVLRDIVWTDEWRFMTAAGAAAATSATLWVTAATCATS